MIHRINQLWDRLESQSRVTQWVAYALIFLVLFVIWSEVVDPISSEWASSADRYERDIQRVKAAGSLDFRSREIADVVSGVGHVTLPSEKAEGQELLLAAVNGILHDSKYRVSDDSVSIRPGSQLGRDALSGIASSQQRVSRVEADIRFSASQDHTVEIVQRLETDPAIENISTLTLQKNGDKLNVIMAVEAWVTEPKSRRDR